MDSDNFSFNPPPNQAAQGHSSIINSGNIQLTPSNRSQRSVQDANPPKLERFDTAPEGFEDAQRDAPFDEQRRLQLQRSLGSTYSTLSKQSIPPPGSVLTGKQEHCMSGRS